MFYAKAYFEAAIDMGQSKLFLYISNNNLFFCREPYSVRSGNIV